MGEPRKQIPKSGPKTGDIETEVVNIKRIVREYYEEPYTYKFKHLSIINSLKDRDYQNSLYKK